MATRWVWETKSAGEACWEGSGKRREDDAKWLVTKKPGNFGYGDVDLKSAVYRRNLQSEHLKYKQRGRGRLGSGAQDLKANEDLCLKRVPDNLKKTGEPLPRKTVIDRRGSEKPKVLLG